jgi:hypothetical protein
VEAPRLLGKDFSLLVYEAEASYTSSWTLEFIPVAGLLETKSYYDDILSCNITVSSVAIRK